jgi:hypothetical protein
MFDFFFIELDEDVKEEDSSVSKDVVKKKINICNENSTGLSLNYRELLGRLMVLFQDCNISLDCFLPYIVLSNGSFYYKIYKPSRFNENYSLN